MIVWRLTREAHQALDGAGARLFGGRWNSEGIPVIYASQSLSLAALEYLVHTDVEDAPPDLVAMAIELPEDAPIASVTEDDLPPDWNQRPDHPACVELGNGWAAEGKALLLTVPSAVVPEERNVLINPVHARAGEVRVVSTRPFAFDPRLA